MRRRLPNTSSSVLSPWAVRRAALSAGEVAMLEVPVLVPFGVVCSSGMLSSKSKCMTKDEELRFDVC